MLDINIIKPVQLKQDLAWQWGDHDFGSLELKDLAKGDKVTVPPSNTGLSLFECWNVCSTHDLVVSVWVLPIVSDWVSNLNLKKILRLAVNIIKRLFFVFVFENFTDGLKRLGHGVVGSRRWERPIGFLIWSVYGGMQVGGGDHVK